MEPSTSPQLDTPWYVQAFDATYLRVYAHRTNEEAEARADGIVKLLGVRAVIAESFERIHRSNLVGMGVLPLQFEEGMTRKKLKLDGSEVVNITGIADGIKPRMTVNAEITYATGKKRKVKLLCRIDTQDEVEYYRHGGILHYVLRNLAGA